MGLFRQKWAKMNILNDYILKKSTPDYVIHDLWDAESSYQIVLILKWIESEWFKVDCELLNIGIKNTILSALISCI